MGTRADFYVGRGPKAEWIGSIAWDGHDDTVLEGLGLGKASDESDWRDRVAKMLASRDDATTPDKGWPWPWEDSSTTDYAYAFDDGAVWWSCFGHAWRSGEAAGPKPVFPDMTSRKAVADGARSGVMLLRVR